MNCKIKIKNLICKRVLVCRSCTNLLNRTKWITWSVYCTSFIVCASNRNRNQNIKSNLMGLNFDLAKWIFVCVSVQPKSTGFHFSIRIPISIIIPKKQQQRNRFSNAIIINHDDWRLIRIRMWWARSHQPQSGGLGVLFT